MIPDLVPLCSSSIDIGKSTSACEAMHKQVSRIVVEKNGTYITGISAEKHGYSTVAVSLSNKQIQCFSVEQQSRIHHFTGHDMPITGIKYSREDSNLLYSSSMDGSIKLWDMRTKGSSVQTYTDDTDERLKPITAFDFSLDENYVCGGTELIREDAFLIFWDRRTSKNLGGYWNSHTEDITQVKFHPYKNCIMASAATDGLINIFDLSNETEDDSLLYTLNTGSSVGILTWNAKENDDVCKNEIACTTHCEEMQLWAVEEANPLIMTDRNTLTKNHSVQVDYLVDNLIDNESVFLVSGSRSGSVHLWNVKESGIDLWSVLNGGHSDDVRAVEWNPLDQTIFTGSEDGILCIWKRDASESSASDLKMMSRVKELSLKHGKKPY